MPSFSCSKFSTPLAGGSSNIRFGYIFSLEICTTSIALSQITLAILGGNAIAGERADRSAEFIAYLPIRRRDLLLSKLSWGLIATIVITSINLPLLVYWLSSIDHSDQVVNSVFSFVTTGICFYGVSLFFSSFQPTPTFAFAGGIITPLLIALGLQMVFYVTGISEDQARSALVPAYLAICLALAVVGTVLGSLIYLRRIEP